MGGSHLFPALQQLSSRKFLHLVPVTVLACVCKLYFSYTCSAISSFSSVSWTVQTLTDLVEMVIHVMDTVVKAIDWFTSLIQQCCFYGYSPHSITCITPSACTKVLKSNTELQFLMLLVSHVLHCYLFSVSQNDTDQCDKQYLISTISKKL